MRLVYIIIIAFSIPLISGCGEEKLSQGDYNVISEELYLEILIDVGNKYLLSQKTTFLAPNQYESDYAVMHLPYDDTSYFGLIVDTTFSIQAIENFEIIEEYHILTTTIRVFLLNNSYDINWETLPSKVGYKRLNLFFMNDLKMKTKDKAEFIGGYSCGRLCGSTSKFFISKHLNKWNIDSTRFISLH
jgi:hypothetical protein